MKNHYEILGVSELAGLNEIKTAYKSLAKKLHPDMNPEKDTDEAFKLLVIAYSTLSDPVKRSKYDNILQQLRLATRSTQAQNKRPFPPTYQNRNRYAKRYKPVFKTDKKTERIATLYALMIIAIFAFIIYIVSLSWNYYKGYQQEQLINTFEDQLELAESYYNLDQQKEALVAIDSLKQFTEANPAIKLYSLDFIGKQRLKADIAYKDKMHKQAIWHILVYMQYTGKQEADMLFNLATSYRAVLEYEKAIFILNKLLSDNYRRMYIITLLAEIYQNDLDNNELAITYYEMALLNIKAEFISTYGDAYRLLVREEKTPYIYKKVYRESAFLYFNLGRYEEARKLLEWVIFFEPEESSGYEFLAKTYLKLNMENAACSILMKAESKNILLDNIRINCND